MRRFTEAICRPLAVEDYVIQTMPDVSPTKWHLGHTSWFFERFILTEHQPGYVPYREPYYFLFNSYYNTVGPMHCRPSRGLISRPTVEEVYAYRRVVDERVAAFLESADGHTLDAVRPLIVLGCHHEQQHQELMVTDIKHVLSSNPLLPAYRAGVPSRESRVPSHAEPARWVSFDGGVREIGLAADDSAFHFDNESPRHKAYLQPFALASRLVTNGDFAAFIADGGYTRHELWLSMGFAQAKRDGWTHPFYWFKRPDDAGTWMHYTLRGAEPIDMSEPACHLSYFEADAFARWAGARLPTEAEWEVASETCDVEGQFADPLSFHPRALEEAPGMPGALSQMFGTLWQWTQSAYLPYPGFKPLPGALGEYNGKFMCGQFVLRGGSCATHSTHIRRTYRNFFPPDARWQFTGLRLAKDLA